MEDKARFTAFHFADASVNASHSFNNVEATVNWIQLYREVCLIIGKRSAESPTP